MHGPLFVVRWRPNETGEVRWGFAVGKRLAKSAVVRNRVRRRMREAARSLPVAMGYDLVVTARQRALEASTAEMTRALRGQLKRAGVLREADPA